MLKYSTIIFDLDGTLLDTLDDLADSVNYALVSCGFPPRSLDEVSAFVGNGVAKLIANAVPAEADEELAATCLARFRVHYEENLASKTAPYPGICGLLSQLRTEGYKLAIVSNKFDGAVKALAGRYFLDLIDVAVGERPGVSKKPAPDTVLIALEELRTDGERAIYVGDSDVDVETAKNAGLPCIGVAWGFRGRQFLLDHGAERVVENTEQLYQTIQSL